jgi:predicted MFS family arabinose efflux permease
VALALAPWLGLELVRRLGFEPLFLASGLAALVAMLTAAALREPERGPAPANDSRLVWRVVNRRALPPAAVLACFGATYAAQVSFLPLYATTYQLGDPGLYFLVFAVVLVLSRSLAGRLADRAGRGASVVPGLVLGGLAMLVLAAASNQIWLLAVAVLYAVSVGLVTTGLMALVIDLTDPAEHGTAMSTYTTAMDLGIALASLGGGYLALWLGFPALFTAAASFGLLGTALYFAWVPAAVRRAAARPCAFRVVGTRGTCLMGYGRGTLVTVDSAGGVSPALCEPARAVLRHAARQPLHEARQWCCPIFDHLLVFEREDQPPPPRT